MDETVKYSLPAPEPELIGKVPRKRNGSSPAPPPDPRSAVERGLVEFDVMASENEHLKRELAAARERARLLELTITELEGTRATIESRINSCVLERDLAVREAGELRGILHGIGDMIARYETDKQP